jgi:hypothetical protein
MERWHGMNACVLADRPLRGGELRRGRQDVHPDEGVPQEGPGRQRAPLRLQPRRGGRQGHQAGRLGDEDPEDERAGAVASGGIARSREMI